LIGVAEDVLVTGATLATAGAMVVSGEEITRALVAGAAVVIVGAMVVTVGAVAVTVGETTLALGVTAEEMYLGDGPVDIPLMTVGNDGAVGDDDMTRATLGVTADVT